VRRIGVGDVAFDVLGSRFGQESDGDEKIGDVIQGTHPFPASAIDLALNLGMPCLSRNRCVIHLRSFGKADEKANACAVTVSTESSRTSPR
jgi:hypothetical protein